MDDEKWGHRWEYYGTYWEDREQKIKEKGVSPTLSHLTPATTTDTTTTTTTTTSADITATTTTTETTTTPVTEQKSE